MRVGNVDSTTVFYDVVFIIGPRNMTTNKVMNLTFTVRFHFST